MKVWFKDHYLGEAETYDEARGLLSLYALGLLREQVGCHPARDLLNPDNSFEVDGTLHVDTHETIKELRQRA